MIIHEVRGLHGGNTLKFLANDTGATFEAYTKGGPEYAEFVALDIDPNQALNLASALLQYATQNGASRE